MPDPPAIPPRKLAHGVVEAALAALAANKLKPAADSMLRAFLAFRAIPRQDEPAAPEEFVEGPHLRAVVKRLFTVYPTPNGQDDASFKGTLQLRGRGAGKVAWMSNDSWRGSFMDYCGPKSPGRHLFQNENWRAPLSSGALALVVDSRGAGDTWPPRDALAVTALCNELLDPTWSWTDVIDHARQAFRLEQTEWDQITTPPVLGAIEPFGGPEWDPSNLSEDLRPSNAPPKRGARSSGGSRQSALVAEQQDRIVDALERHGTSKFVALAGVPGTGKSHVGSLAATAFASPGCVERIQFSPGYPYEDFVEGPRFTDGGKVVIEPGVLLTMNGKAITEPDKRWVLFIEEFTRADLPRVLGELLTFIEYRDQDFFTMYNRKAPVRLARNLAFLVTYNPTDRSAVALDAALLRRMEVVDFLPRIDLLRDILTNTLPPAAIAQLERLFERCQEEAGERFAEVMPFGHATFAGISDEADLHRLWVGQLQKMLVRPNTPKHELYDVIADAFPWRQGPGVVVTAQPEDTAASHGDQGPYLGAGGQEGASVGE